MKVFTETNKIKLNPQHRTINNPRFKKAAVLHQKAQLRRVQFS